MTTLRFHATQIRMAIIEKSRQQMWERMWERRNSSSLLVRMEIDIASMGSSVKLLNKLEIKLPCEPDIPLLKALYFTIEIYDYPCLLMH